MQLTISLVPDFCYSTSVHQFPVNVTISTDVPVEIYSRADVSAALLTKVGSPEICFGYVRRVLPAKRTATILTAESPLHMEFDVLEHDDDFEEFLPGDYQCEVKIEVAEKVGDEFRVAELHGSLTVTLP